VHGSGGIGANYDRWSEELNGVGIATFLIDGFTARGIASTVEDQEQLGRLTMIYDVYRALALLAAHPRIDPARIAILGGSRGGQIALYASLRRFQRAYGRPGVEFAAYVPLYAPCNTTYIDDTDVNDRPIRLLHGGADDYVPVTPCRVYVEHLRAVGKDVQITEYPDAHHVFDNPLFPTTPTVWARAQTTRRCILKEEPRGRIINAETGQPFTYADPCVERGVHVAYNPAAYAAALRAVKEFLRATFKLN
jgi:dienelactone hydrolase